MSLAFLIYSLQRIAPAVAEVLQFIFQKFIIDICYKNKM